MPRTSRRVAAGLAAMTLVVAACGDDDSGTATNSSTPASPVDSAETGPGTSRPTDATGPIGPPGSIGGSQAPADTATGDSTATGNASATDDSTAAGGSQAPGDTTTGSVPAGGGAAPSPGETELAKAVERASTGKKIGVPLDVGAEPAESDSELGLTADASTLASMFKLRSFIYPDITDGRVISFQASARPGLASMEQSANIGVAFESKMPAQKIAGMIRNRIQPKGQYRMEKAPAQQGMVSFNAIPKQRDAGLPTWVVAVMSTDELRGGEQMPGNRFVNVGMIGQPIEQADVAPPEFVDAGLTPITKVTLDLRYDFYGWSYGYQTDPSGGVAETFEYRFVTTDKKIGKTANDIAAKVGAVKGRKNTRQKITFSADGVDWIITPQGSAAAITNGA